MPTTSIIIVTYNNEKEIPSCLDSVFSQAGPQTEIIVVDNGSTDRTLAALERHRKRVKIVRVPSNPGYAKANNIGFRCVSGEYVFLLNPDTVVGAGAIERMINYLDRHDEVAILAPLIRNMDGSPQPSVRRFPSFRILLFELLGLPRLFPRSTFFNTWRIPEFDFSTQQEVEQPMAAALLLRKRYFGEELMDERFTMFFNDVDLCRRAWQGGGKVLFFPDAEIYHARGASTSRVKEKMIPLHTKGFIRYFRKHGGSGFERSLLSLCIPFLVLNAVVRIFLLRVLGMDL